MSDELAKRSDDVLSDTSLSIDAMYDVIEKTITALDNTTVGDFSPDLAPEMQAHSNAKFVPATEIEMVQMNAVPMSDIDIEAFRQQKERRESVQYRRKQLQIPTLSLTEITGARVRVAYRLVKYMATIRGIGGLGTPLIMSMASQNDQINLFELPMPYDPMSGWFRGLAPVRNLLTQADEMGYKYSYLLQGNYYVAHGMSILPPPIHDGYFPTNTEVPLWQYRRTRYTPPTYTAMTDTPLAIYLNICELLVRHLGIAVRGVDMGDGPTKRKHDTFRDLHEQAAVTTMLDPMKARTAWPSRDDIETFEESVLMPYVARIMARMSQDSSIDFLMKEMGLTHAEAFDLVECYKTYAKYANVFNAENERAIEMNRLDRLADTCSEAGMVTTELNARKAKMQALGLTRHEEDSNIDKRAHLESVLEADIIKRSKDNKELPGTEADD